MQLYKNNYFYGWKYNASARKLNESKSSTGFVMSLITALIIVMVVSQVLSLIDHKIQYKDLKGYSFNEAFQPKQAFASGISDRLSGKILLQVESNGEGWYINPKNLKRYYLGRPDDAFRIMRELSLGISNNDFDDFHGYAPLRLSGQILLKVEDSGKAYYVNPDDLKMYYLGRPSDAYNVMRNLGLGITNQDIETIEVEKGYDVEVIKNDNSQVENSVDEVQPVDNTVDNPVSDVQDNTNANLDTDNTTSDTQTDSNNVAVNDCNALIVASSNMTKKCDVKAIVGDGPNIRVGLLYSQDPQIIKSSSSFNLLNSNGTVLLNVPANKSLTVDYNETTGKYAYGYGVASTLIAGYLTLDQIQDNAYFTIETFENRPGWNPSINDNTFLGDLELRYNNSKDRTWVINELPMEKYLEGIAETSNTEESEYLKTMAIASRTYASYHLDRNYKHKDEFFTVDSKYDQVYKGYGISQRLTNFVKAVQDTKGIIVTYDGKLALTPYFSWSDGKTRSNKEVWGTDKPWLISVVEPKGYDKTTLFGHGVGISARGAFILAQDFNYTFDNILKYYYTGTDLASNYNSMF